MLEGSGFGSSPFAALYHGLQQMTDRPQDSQAPAQPRKRLWAFMYALGAAGPPPLVRLAEKTLRLQRPVKHDFWAATAFYVDADSGETAVVKFGRIQRLVFLPMRWSGRILAQRESHFYQRLADVSAVPQWMGMIQPPWVGFAHAYVVGRPMSDVPVARLDARFFADLAQVLALLHDRGIAYVDLHKPQNVLIDDEGRPHLIDFQISYDIDSGMKRWLLPRFVRRWFLRAAVRADRYHLLKHKKFLRPDLLGAQESQEVERRAWFIRLHRRLVAPYRFVRRRLLSRWRRSGRLLPEGSK